MTADEFCQAVVTFDDRDKGEALARTIVGERLAACAQIDGPITSVFWWEGEPQTEEEWRVEFKTRTALLDALTARVLELHEYDTPQVVALPITGGSEAYLQWMRDETAAASAGQAAEEAVTG